MIDDIAIDALSLAIQGGIAHLQEAGTHYTETGWRTVLDGHRTRARAAILSGDVERAVAEVRPYTFSAWLAALAMLPGGLRLFEVVFCARHYPAGIDARYRLSCPMCSPDDRSWGETRDVITIEGIL